MKIIDETGRVFGKINIIDLLVILFLVGLMPAFYAGYKIMTAKPVEIVEIVEIPVVPVEPPKEVKKEKIRIELEVKNLNPEIAKFIKAGDSQIKIDAKGDAEDIEVIARIIKIISNQPTKIASLNKKRTDYNIIEYPQTRDIILDIEILCLPNPEGVLFEGKPVKIGRDFEFSTTRYEISGTVIGIQSK